MTQVLTPHPSPGMEISILFFFCFDGISKVIAAEGEEKASSALRAASEMITCSPGALQLRYLQTLNSISAEKNSTIIFPVPMDLISNFLERK